MINKFWLHLQWLTLTAPGTFVTGESRLLFSSAQVDYIRYWLHAMQLTKEVIPLPYSDCLLTESNLRNVSPVVYHDGGSLRNAIKVRVLNGLFDQQVLTY